MEKMQSVCQVYSSYYGCLLRNTSQDSFDRKCNTALNLQDNPRISYFTFYSVSKPFLRMTIQNRIAISARECSQAGNNGKTLNWNLSPDEIRTKTDNLINRVKKVYDEVGSLNIENVSVENTLKALAHAKLDYACKY